ncbi:uncharacterized protein LOC131618219 [Vicia villosa]|uniref:uncharacterized protein LOC131618219 n=1 Tax=Vicia villosa TaxID=3911 RepID=UPI00273B88A7|nr:uncharacterized protein LOC131618219 [Vicia villosa]
MVHPDMFAKTTVRMNVKPSGVKDDVKLDEVKDDVKPRDIKPGVRPVVVKVDVCEKFINKQEVTIRENMLQWVCMEVEKLGSGGVTGRYNNGSNRIKSYVRMRCVRNGTYQPPNMKLKHDDTESRKCECRFKLCGYHKENHTRKFNMVFGIHNHSLNDKLVGYPIVCRLIPEENKVVSNMTLNTPTPKIILATLKWKRPHNVSNIKQVYNVRAQNNLAVRGPRSEMKQLLKLLEDDHYVYRFRVLRIKSQFEIYFY